MAHHKSTPKANIITVKDGNNTYTASWDGEKKSCTAGPEQAARHLASKILGIAYEAVTMQAMKTPQIEGKPHVYRFKVCPL